jgi:hypothetical protein
MIERGSTMLCRKCESEMVPDYDHANRVRVVVCSNPSCLHREYPDYPRRNGNQEICYICGRLFTFKEDDLGVICQECKNEVKRRRRNRPNRVQRDNVRCAL